MPKSPISDLAIDDLPDPIGRPPPQYIDLDTLRNADNLVATISQRRSNGILTFAIFKEFERDRRIERTSFIAESLAESLRGLLDITIKRMAEINAKPDVLRALQVAALEKLGVSQAQWFGRGGHVAPRVEQARGRR